VGVLLRVVLAVAILVSLSLRLTGGWCGGGWVRELCFIRYIWQHYSVWAIHRIQADV